MYGCVACHHHGTAKHNYNRRCISAFSPQTVFFNPIPITFTPSLASHSHPTHMLYYRKRSFQDTNREVKMSQVWQNLSDSSIVKLFALCGGFLITWASYPIMAGIYLFRDEAPFVSGLVVFGICTIGLAARLTDDTSVSMRTVFYSALIGGFVGFIGCGLMFAL